MEDIKATDSVFGLFLRLYWMIIGNGALVIAAAAPLAYQKIPITASLAATVIVSISLIAARYCDVRFCGGQTVDGDPANLGHWKRHVMILLPISLLLPIGVWALKALAN